MRVRNVLITVPTPCAHAPHRGPTGLLKERSANEERAASTHGATPQPDATVAAVDPAAAAFGCRAGDRKSTRLNSSHSQISYAVFCLKKKKKKKKKINKHKITKRT